MTKGLPPGLELNLDRGKSAPRVAALGLVLRAFCLWKNRAKAMTAIADISKSGIMFGNVTTSGQNI